MENPSNLADSCTVEQNTDDSKSTVGNHMRVQVPPSAPTKSRVFPDLAQAENRGESNRTHDRTSDFTKDESDLSNPRDDLQPNLAQHPKLYRKGKKGIWQIRFLYKGREYRESTHTVDARLAWRCFSRRLREIQAGRVKWHQRQRVKRKHTIEPEAHIQALLVDRLKQQTKPYLQNPREQVLCSTGIIDVVTAGALIEVKAVLDGASLTSAVGQLLMYGAAWREANPERDWRLIIVAKDIRITEAHARHAETLGIKIFTANLKSPHRRRLRPAPVRLKTRQLVPPKKKALFSKEAADRLFAVRVHAIFDNRRLEFQSKKRSKEPINSGDPPELKATP